MAVVGLMLIELAVTLQGGVCVCKSEDALIVKLDTYPAYEWSSDNNNMINITERLAPQQQLQLKNPRCNTN